MNGSEFILENLTSIFMNHDSQSWSYNQVLSWTINDEHAVKGLTLYVKSKCFFQLLPLFFKMTRQPFYYH